MKTAFYPKLAFIGIKKNRKLYLPYILSCIGMVMMGYIVQSLSYSPVLRQMRGGSNMEAILSLGKLVIAFFTLLFLFYTNSFLVRRRFKEFGLYSILGMGKKSIAKIVLWESLITAVLGLTGGIGLGIVFSKFAELGLLNAINAESIDYSFTVSAEAIYFTVFVFGIIFILLALKSLITVAKCNPLELLKSEKNGEKPPKANWVLAVAGAVLLIGAYVISVTISSPLSALALFFVAVIMVIVATYLLFISGSVALCKILQKSKKYYYKKNHFVSVSSMSYRMKRNGAGLASICILATMVLVMIASTASLYFGISDTIKLRFPQETQFLVDFNNITECEQNRDAIKQNYEKTFRQNQFTPANVTEYTFSSLLCVTNGTDINLNPTEKDFSFNFADVRNVLFITASEYNRLMKTDYNPQKGEAFIYTLRCDFNDKNITMGNTKFSIAGKVNSYPVAGNANVEITPIIAFIVSDYSELCGLDKLYTSQTQEKILANNYYYGYDNKGLSDEKAIELYDAVSDSLGDYFANTADSYGYSSSCFQAEKSDFYTSFGGLFFIGIILSIVFIFAAAIIIYYKQISEGYEDNERFTIMQKVGMTKSDIKKSINSQILIVFFAPLLFAGLHFGFAFPLIWKILQLFQLRSLSYVISVSAISFAIFGIFYVAIYKLTAHAYFSIVSSKEK